VPGDTELSDNENVERHVEHARDFECHGNAAARQGEYDHVRAAGVRRQRGGKSAAGVGAIGEA
jgi:hypothetical protein